MVIVNQDKTMMLNFENIEAIGIGNPLENSDGKFQILVDTTSDNQYSIAEYGTEERAKEVLESIAVAYSDFKYYAAEHGKHKTEIGIDIHKKYRSIDWYEIPEE